MKRKTRKRARSVALDVAVLGPTLAEASTIGKIATAAGMRLVTARAWPCVDGTFTIRTVWRGGAGSLQTSMVETIRGLRRPS